MKMNKVLKFGMFFLVGVLLVSFSSAYMKSYNVQYGQYVSGSGGEWISDREMCEAGQDFIVQIEPFGCTPAVVRADLLEEQNVPVFCQLSATNINPLIKVEAIENMDIGFSGKRPEQVSGVGFHPARAALGVKGDLNSPFLDNIGYVVVVLRKEENASAMPKNIEGNLTAKLRYDIKNAYGIGKATFYVPELSDEEWEDKKVQYSFWDGRFYLKADSIDPEGAEISIYDDSRRIANVDLDKGKTSNDLRLPGFDCLANARLKLNGLVAPDTRAKLNINGQIVEVADNEKFLENRCTVRDIDKKGLVQEVDISCKEDEGREKFTLKISPRVKLNINGDEIEYEVGERIPFSDDPNKYVYLGYVGVYENSNKKENLYVHLVQTPYQGSRLPDNILSEVSRYSEANWEKQKGSLSKKILLFIEKSITTYTERIIKYLGKGTEISDQIKYSDGKKDVYGIEFSILGFADSENEELDFKAQDYYDDAIRDYDAIIESYSAEKMPNQDKTYGEQALEEKIIFVYDMGQKRRVVELCKEFEERYPKSRAPSDVCSNDAKLSSDNITTRDVSINGLIKRISFEGVYEPTLDEYSVEISVSNVDDENCLGSKILRKNDDSCFSDSEYVKLKELDEDYAIFDVFIDESWWREAGWKTNQVKINLGDFKVIGENNYKISVDKINLKKSAKVSVIPGINNAGTEANFSFKIGIEQRAIELSPEKTRKKIEKINKTIEKWEEKSEQIGKVVKGLKGACLATGTFLTIKNLISNAGGKSIARQKVMNDIWYPKCSDNEFLNEKGYRTVNECLTKESNNIDDDVDRYYRAIKEQNEKFEELEKGISTREHLTERHVNTGELMKKYYPIVKDDLSDLGTISDPLGKGDPIDVSKNSDVYKAFEVDDNGDSLVSLSDAREIELLRKVGDNERLYQKLTDIKVTTERGVEIRNIAEDIEQSGLKVGVSSYGSSEAIVGVYSGGVIHSGQISGVELEEKDEGGKIMSYPVEIITYNSEKYVAILGGAGKDYVVDKVYEYEGVSNGVIQAGSEKPGIVSKFKSFKKYDETSYSNKYESAIGETTECLRYYETEPYKGLPAVVPFDLDNGWYAKVEQTLPVFGGIGAYDDSGRVTSFWVCNVGPNGIEENKKGDDICEMINTGTGQPYNQFPGLTENKASKIIKDAQEAIERASRIYKSGISGSVKISSKATNVKVCSPAVDIPDMQCQSFMSPKDCQILFNVCDPVVCPSSRCDFGGTYPVKDVIQSGIIGSIALCLPNVREGIYIPICLTGIKAGIDGLLSVFTSYRDCLQESLDTGKMVGICDEIYSIHLCEFFWRQSLPIAKLILPKVMEIALGQNVRGGGEYLGVAEAWKNAGNSMDFFIQYYAADSAEAFKARVAEGVGDAVCQNSISTTYPEGGDILDSLIEPDSPPQFHGRFDEIPFTTATNPPISHYKVFYHIYAGKESRAYYKVYLRSPPGSSFYQDASDVRYVATGYIPTGEYATETKDFTGPSGYKELCIMVNGQEECGFKEVSTSYALNYINDKFMEEQTSADDITTEKECVSGSVSLYSLLSPNLQEGADELLNPAIYDRGIIRICATESPGKGTDSKDGANGSRWLQVGYCSEDKKIKCWLDRESVEDVIKHTDIEKGVLEEHTQNQLELLQKSGEYLKDSEYVSKIEEKEAFEGKSEWDNVIDLVDENLKKVFWNSQKARLLLNRAGAYAELARPLKSKADDEESKIKASDQEYCENICEGSGAKYGLHLSDLNKGCPEDYKDEDLVSKGADCCCYGTGALETIEEDEKGPELKDADLKTPSGHMEGVFEKNNNEYNKIIEKYSQQYDVSENMIKAIISQESAGNPEAENGSSKGLMQVTEGAAIDVGLIEKFENNQWRNPDNNIQIGTAYYAHLRDKYYKDTNSGEDLKKITLAAYNWGLGKINRNCQDKKWENCEDIPKVVLEYISNILEYEKQFSGKVATTVSSGETEEGADKTKLEQIDEAIEKVGGFIEEKSSIYNYDHWSDEAKIYLNLLEGRGILTSEEVDYIRDYGPYGKDYGYLLELLKERKRDFENKETGKTALTTNENEEFSKDEEELVKNATECEDCQYIFDDITCTKELCDAIEKKLGEECSFRDFIKDIPGISNIFKGGMCRTVYFKKQP